AGRLVHQRRPRPPAQPVHGPPAHRGRVIAVVGGGITGLATGRALARRGAEAVVLEASSRVGGVSRSAEVEGRVLDWGPQRTRLTGPLASLVAELGLADEVLTAPAGLPLFVYRDGKLRVVPFDARAFLASDLVSLAGKARMLDRKSVV